MSENNPLVKIVKKSVGLPTGESDCCGVVAPQVSQGTASQNTGEQPAANSSGCAPQAAIDLPKGESHCCGAAAPQAAQETADQCAGEQSADTSSCCG